MRTYDLSPLFRSTVGFDRMARLLESTMAPEDGPSYPPYNIEKLGETSYRIAMAVAGFGRDDIEITVKESSLTVKGVGKTADDGITFLHRGIATRGFERRFDLADHIEVVSADLTDGMLLINLERRVPEALKPRTIAINGGTPQRVIDGNGDKQAA